MAKTPSRTKKRLIFAFVFICFLCVALTFRVGWVQIVNGEEYSRLAVQQQIRDDPVVAKRGMICDRNGEVLAISATTFAIWARPGQVRSTNADNPALSEVQVENTAAELALVLGMEKEQAKEIITQERTLVKVAKQVDKERADMIREKRLKGIEISEDVKRYYPLGVFASHLLGSVTDDNNGLFGIELQYDRYLSGIPGRWIKNADTAGNSISYGIERYYKAEDGLNVILTVDEVIQHYVEKALESVMEKTEADGALCLVMDPKTGDILAMAVLPDFDPNNPRVPLNPDAAAYVDELPASEKTAYWNAMWRNPVISNVYDPGSTFKLLTTAMALEESVTYLSDRFVCNGSYNVSGTTLRCWYNPRTHGSQNLVEAVGNSCNPVFMQLVQRLGESRFYQYLDLFGMSERTGIDFPGEAYPQLQDKATAGPVGLATMSYGQGISITPLQLLAAASSFGNEGKLMQPRLVKALTDSAGNVVEEFGTKVVRQVVSKQTAEDICFIMESVVSEGGGGAAKIPGYRIGGKTGTAIKAVDGRYYENLTDSSFLGMAPMDDPKVSILLVVDNPKGVKFGSVTAAPGVRQILEDTLRYLNVQPHYTQAELGQMNKGMTTVPDIAGKNFSEAIGILVGASLDYAVSPAHDSGEDFMVVDQYPKAGEKLNTGGIVYIYKE
ncbi:MAG: penicillin-binding transpeptidase domain-containing protein [Clostridiales bacterium]|nr:penicillin-binding transpeptidase domain-containing protein [Clostridiales bacterium]